MIYILLQAIDPLVFQDATPFGTAIYGLLVLALVGAIIYLVKKLDSKDKDYKDLAEKTMVVITEVKEKILDIRDHRATVITKLDDLYKEITRLKNDHD
jgi:flagellar biogenesis protein FliO